MQWRIWFERGAHAWLKGEWCSSLNNSTLCVLTTTGRHCLEICNYSNCDFDKWASNTLFSSKNTGCVNHEESTKSIRLQSFNLPAFGLTAFKIVQIYAKIFQKILFRWVFDWGINSTTLAKKTERTLLTYKLRCTAFSPLFTIKMNHGNVYPQVRTQKAHLRASTIVWQLAAREEECWIGYSCWMLITAFYGVEEITS